MQPSRISATAQNRTCQQRFAQRMMPRGGLDAVGIAAGRPRRGRCGGDLRRSAQFEYRGSGITRSRSASATPPVGVLVRVSQPRPARLFGIDTPAAPRPDGHEFPQSGNDRPTGDVQSAYSARSVPATFSAPDKGLRAGLEVTGWEVGGSRHSTLPRLYRRMNVPLAESAPRPGAPRCRPTTIFNVGACVCPRRPPGFANGAIDR